jgi:hypothetical protein
MKKIICFILILAVWGFGSYARIESMGKTDNYTEDDMSIFVNPANTMLYQSYIFGELGTTVKGEDTAQFTDPYTVSESVNNPWFGGIFSKKFKNGSSFALGLAFNREDKWLSLLNRTIEDANNDDNFINIDFAVDTAGDTTYYTSHVIDLPKAINEVDFMLGFRHSSRFSLGGHIYFAANKDNKWFGPIDEAEKYSKREAFLLKSIIGFNKHFKSNLFLEGSFGTAILDFTFSNLDNTLTSVPKKGLNLFGRTRMYIPLSERFSFVPIVNFEQVFLGKTTQDWRTSNALREINDINDYMDFSGGLGINYWEMEKTTEFILGVEFHYLTVKDEQQMVTKDNSLNITSSDVTREQSQDIYTVVNFGIERQLFWEWFLARAGGRKVLGLNRKVENYETNPTTGDLKKVHTDERMWENPDNNDTRSDLIGVGVGIRFLRKLQMDFTLSETMPYRVMHLFSGVEGNIFTRFSCAYYF